MVIFIYQFIILFLVLFNNGFSNEIKINKKINFWNSQKKGANIFNQEIYLEDIKAAKKYGIEFIRLAPDKFIGTKRDFLIGDSDNYKGLIKEDLEKLKKILDMFYEEGIPVIITMLSLPGSRWKQNNNNIDDLKIWDDEKLMNLAILFWHDLANELKNHKAIVGYNILNEPHLNNLNKTEEEIKEILYNFYQKTINQIRLVDLETPIILDSSEYASPNSFKFLKINNDEKILYSFHMYEPHEYTNKKINNGSFSYPGIINKKELMNYMSNVIEFQKIYKIDSNRILVGEFGGNRFSKGIENYFSDLISIFYEKKWHFAFYAFREDVWDGMDYELGNKKFPEKFWDLNYDERNKQIKLYRNQNNSIFSVILNGLTN